MNHLLPGHCHARVNHRELVCMGQRKAIPIYIPDDFTPTRRECLDCLDAVLGEFPDVLEWRAVAVETIEHESHVLDRHGKGFPRIHRKGGSWHVASSEGAG